MIRTPICELLGIEHPICLGGMGTGTSPELVSAVSNAGGLGALGCHGLRPEQVDERTQAFAGKPTSLSGATFFCSMCGRTVSPPPSSCGPR